MILLVLLISPNFKFMLLHTHLLLFQCMYVLTKVMQTAISTIAGDLLS